MKMRSSLEQSRLISFQNGLEKEKGLCRGGDYYETHGMCKKRQFFNLYRFTLRIFTTKFKLWKFIIFFLQLRLVFFSRPGEKKTGPTYLFLEKCLNTLCQPTTGKKTLSSFGPCLHVSVYMFLFTCLSKPRQTMWGLVIHWAFWSTEQKLVRLRETFIRIWLGKVVLIAAKQKVLSGKHWQPNSRFLKEDNCLFSRATAPARKDVICFPIFERYQTFNSLTNQSSVVQKLRSESSYIRWVCQFYELFARFPNFRHTF